MCGIAGFLTRAAAGPEAAACVTAMTRTLAHRGPDSEGLWIDSSAGVALGHRRLSVVDLSVTGNQPMWSAGGRYVMVFNGEIYNFQDLRKHLEHEPRACEFRGHSDTEVMLACFDRWGVADSVSRFNGMFAFAVWDRRERTLHLARDPLGEKPLYYGWARDTLVFGSELKALRAHPQFENPIDRDVLALFLRYGYVPAPYSIYRNVFKLRPGTMLTIEPGSRATKTVRYWSLNQVLERARAEPFDRPEPEAQKELESLLADATRIRMIADVPLGAFLSGGIDSSLVVALMQSQSAKPVKTFTIGFHESEYNEAADAKAVAQHLHTDHTECYVTPAEAREVVPRLPALYDEPFADSSQIPTYLVAALARRHVTVSLSGDGGDELFGGYGRYARISGLRAKMALIPGPLRAALAGALKTVTSPGARRPRRLAAALSPNDPAAMYDTWCCHWLNAGEVVRGASAPPLPGDHSEWPHCDDFVQHMMAVDTVTYLPDDILVKVDRASMGVSLESRIPLLDPRVVEFAWKLPPRMKVRGQQTKWILRQILYRYVPPALVERPKRGFAVPVAEWIRGPLRDWAEELLDAGRLEREGYVASKPIRRIWREHLSATADHSAALWCVLMFQAWLENQTSAGTRGADFAAA